MSLGAAVAAVLVVAGLAVALGAWRTETRDA
jgi:hypothetical protein